MSCRNNNCGSSGSQRLFGTSALRGVSGAAPARSNSPGASAVRGTCTRPGSYEPTMKVRTASTPCGDTYGTGANGGGCQCGACSGVTDTVLFTPAEGVFASDTAQTVTDGVIALNTAVNASPTSNLTLDDGGVTVEEGGRYSMQFTVHASDAAIADAAVFLTLNGLTVENTAVPLIAGEFQTSGMATLDLEDGDVVGLGATGGPLILTAGVNNALLNIRRYY